MSQQLENAIKRQERKYLDSLYNALIWIEKAQELAGKESKKEILEHIQMLIQDYLLRRD